MVFVDPTSKLQAARHEERTWLTSGEWKQVSNVVVKSQSVTTDPGGLVFIKNKVTTMKCNKSTPLNKPCSQGDHCTKHNTPKPRHPHIALQKCFHLFLQRAEPRMTKANRMPGHPKNLLHHDSVYTCIMHIGGGYSGIKVHPSWHDQHLIVESAPQKGTDFNDLCKELVLHPLCCCMWLLLAPLRICFSHTQHTLYLNSHQQL